MGISGIVQAQPQAGEQTYVIPIKGEINQAVASYVNKAVQQAQDAGATQIIFAVDTYGGLIEAAVDISEHMLGASVPTVTYIENNAISAGVIISLSADKVVANQRINIGSAETVPKTEKSISFWTGKLRSVAELKGRDPEIVAAMADADIVIEGVKEEGKLLNLTASQALDYGIVDQIVDGKAQLYEYLDIDTSQVVELTYDFQTNIARFTNSIYVSTILLMLGMVGIVGEIFTAGFGVFGSIGIFSFALYFAGRVLAGHAGWGVLILFVAGLILIGVEISMPGFGIPGLTGISCIVLSILVGSPNPTQAAVSFSIAILLSIIVLIMVFRYAPRNQLFSHIILKSEQKNTSGYVSHESNQETLVGMEGEALTLLRPAGTVMIGEKRVSVVSEGAYIKKGAKVKVIAVEGSRIIVREKK